MSGRLALALLGARDGLRRPLEGALLAIALAATTLLCATALLLVRAVGDTASAALDGGPAIVARRVDPRGFSPIAAAEAIAAARRVPGVTGARARLWGTVSGPTSAITVIGVDAAIAPRLLALGLPSPMRGDAIAGPGIAAGHSIALRGAAPVDVTIVGRLPAEVGTMAADAVLLADEDARLVLGVGPGEASDLAIDVFHDAEAAALAGELAVALPWPSRIVTRREMRGLYATELGRRGGLAAFAAAPAVLALIVLVVGAVRDRLARRRELGLLKALGFTTRDVVIVHLARSLVIALPATAIGLAGAVAVVLWPGAVWPGSLLLGWTAAPPLLAPGLGGAIAVLVETTAIVLVPWIAAAIAPTIVAATTDPGALIAEDA